MPKDGRTKVAIVGFCSTSRDAVPYDDPEMEVWGLNRGYIFMPRADRWFEMHSAQIYGSQQRRPGKHVQWLNDFPGPVYMHRVFEDVHNSVAYPLKEVAELLGQNVFRLGYQHKPAGNENSSGGPVWVPEGLTDITGEPYLSSSIAFEIALAIYEGFQEIHLYGVDLNTESEYAWQKPGVEYLVGFASARGIKVVLPDNCPLLKGTLYGRGFLSERPEHMSYEQLADRAKNLQHELEQLGDERAAMRGAAQECAFQLAQMNPGIDHEANDKRRQAMQNRLRQLDEEILVRKGALKETLHWLHQTMAGQEPKEAIQQLRQLDHGVEGPRTDLEALQDKDTRLLATVGAN